MNKLSTPVQVGLSGRYKIEAVKEDGSVRLVTDWFNNLITNIGLDRMGVGDYSKYCSVGTGSAAPANTDTALVGRVATSDGNYGSFTPGAQQSEPYFGYTRVTYAFPIGAAAGNLSEIGVGWGADGTNLFSRALIRDSGGAPTTITILSDEVLTVTYELRLYPPLTDSVSTASIGGTSRTITVRAAFVKTANRNFYGWAPYMNGAMASKWFTYFGNEPAPQLYGGSSFVFGPITDDGFTTSQTDGRGTPTGDSTYSPGTYYRDTTMFFDVNANLTSAFLPVKGVLLALTHGAFKVMFEPPLEKDNTKTLTLTFRISWARHT